VGVPASRLHPSLHLDTLRATALTVADGSELPRRLVVVPWGEHSARKRGVVKVSQATLDGFAANQEAMRLDRVAIDFEHNTVPGTPAYEAGKEPREVAGYGTPMVVLGVGVVLDQIEWTPAGAKAIAGGHYQDLSPTAFRTEDGTVVGLHSVALCRHGELEGLTLDAAKAAASMLPLFAALSAELSESPKPYSIQNPAMKEALLKLLKLLGLDVSETMEEDAMVALMNGKADELAAKAAEKKPEEEAKPDAMSAELASVRAELDTVRKERLLDQARIEGKVIPLSAESIKVTPLSVLEDLVKQAKPGEVPLKGAGDKVPGLGAGGSKPDAFTAEEKEVFQKFGLTPETVAENEKSRATAKAA
jgi:phage I-like protein